MCYSLCDCTFPVTVFCPVAWCFGCDVMASRGGARTWIPLLMYCPESPIENGALLLLDTLKITWNVPRHTGLSFYCGVLVYILIYEEVFRRSHAKYCKGVQIHFCCFYMILMVKVVCVCVHAVVQRPLVVFMNHTAYQNHVFMLICFNPKLN